MRDSPASTSPVKVFEAFFFCRIRAKRKGGRRETAVEATRRERDTRRVAFDS